jgi:hypothetical protein
VGRARFVLAAAVIALVACSCGRKGRPQATVRQFASVIDEQRPKIEPAWSGYQSVWTNVENHAPGVSLNAPCSGGVSNLVLGTEPFRTIADDFKRLGSPRPRFATLSRAPAPRHVSRQPCQPVREFTAVPRVAATLLAQPALVSRIPRVPRSGAASPVPCFLVSPRNATPGRTDHPEPATNRARAPNRLRRWTVQAQDGRCRRKWSVRRRWSPVRVALVQERSDGSVRLAPTLVQELAATMPRWARLVAPHAEAVAHLLGRAVRGQYQPRPPLTGGKLRGAQAVVRAREVSAKRAAASATSARAVARRADGHMALVGNCMDCGGPLTRARHLRCENCQEKIPGQSRAVRRQRGRAIAAAHAGLTDWRSEHANEDRPSPEAFAPIEKA